MIKEMISKTLSRRDNMLVENERISSYRRPIRDGMWESQHLAMSRMGLNMYNPLQAERSWGYKITFTLSELRSSSICYHDNHINHSSDRFSTQMTQIKQINADKKKICGHLLNLRHLRAYCLNQDLQDYRIYRMRKIEVENTKIGGAAAIYTLSSWHCCRDAMLRVSKNNEKETNLVRHCGLDPQSPFIRFIRHEASRIRHEVSHIRHEVSRIRHETSRIRREASRLYNLGDSDFRQNDGYRYTEEMSRMGLNMYNPLQAERSWGYRKTPTLSELRSSSIYRRSDNADLKRFSQIRKKSAVICINLRHLRTFCLLSFSLNNLKLVQTYV